MEYLPSGPVEPTRLVPSIRTRASWSGVPPGCVVTVPVGVPCALATAAAVVNSAADTALMARLRRLIDVIVLASLRELGEKLGARSPRAGATAWERAARALTCGWGEGT